MHRNGRRASCTENKNRVCLTKYFNKKTLKKLIILFYLLLLVTLALNMSNSWTKTFMKRRPASNHTIYQNKNINKKRANNRKFSHWPLIFPYLY